ncbi:MAG TPA: sigma-54-dependent Fis family transcriptional regulator [Deltaproteobacteria bacterium]|nr:MAG: sigma-54-dependent Fis family transcriptional regulator [Deltaproteobacteria bacterium]RLB08993.1 MAG: sigma-54-dependent Fis family transcriptional regulator [Deltaproteobacteria bacterium]HDM78281.1 sigma-54-dependent Fis family transcriptional regulator [Deltaproteobacteria bacterium]
MEKVLVVDDELSMREFLEIMLLNEGYSVVTAENGGEALKILEKEPVDLIITDIRMNGIDGLQVLKKSKEINPNTIVIMISAYASAETAVQAMKEGAYDYLPKPFKLKEIKKVIREALNSRKPSAEERSSRDILHFGLLVGESPQMHKVYDLIRRVASTPSNILLTGESGTGKELIARAIHQESDRKDGPFVAVNCGGMPENLMESELFGYKKGAFTGATSTKPGLVEAAKGGTLFLDEIGELSTPLQVKLLRLIQEKTYKMVGGTEDIKADVRFISATNQDLEQKIIKGSFREDLYYRLNVIHIRIPPLRERTGDIPLLAQYFLEKYSRQFGKEIRKISTYALDILKGYNFPGNVRELENIIERSVALESSNIVLPDSLTLSAYKKSKTTELIDPGQIVLPREGLNLDDFLAGIEKELLAQALSISQGTKQKAAELLGISLRSLRYRLAKYGLSSEDD